MICLARKLSRSCRPTPIYLSKDSKLGGVGPGATRKPDFVECGNGAKPIFLH
jgi:hypothetical protein